MIKVHLPASAFVECACGGEQSSLFHKVADVRNIKKSDLEEYLELVCKMFELSPEG